MLFEIVDPTHIYRLYVTNVLILSHWPLCCDPDGGHPRFIPDQPVLCKRFLYDKKCICQRKQISPIFIVTFISFIYSFLLFFQYGGGAIIGTLKTSLSPILVHSGRNSASPIKVWASFVLSVDVMGCYVLIVIGPMIYG